MKAAGKGFLFEGEGFVTQQDKLISPAPTTDFSPWAEQDQEPLVQFRNVTKRFGSFVAVDNVSLNIYQREFFALLGPSGCGKTTLMRMLAGFETPTSGEIIVDVLHKLARICTYTYTHGCESNTHTHCAIRIAPRTLCCSQRKH